MKTDKTNIINECLWEEIVKRAKLLHKLNRGRRIKITVSEKRKRIISRSNNRSL